jgi:hypothetical protein
LKHQHQHHRIGLHKFFEVCYHCVIPISLIKKNKQNRTIFRIDPTWLETRVWYYLTPECPFIEQLFDHCSPESQLSSEFLTSCLAVFHWRPTILGLCQLIPEVVRLVCKMHNRETLMSHIVNHSLREFRIEFARNSRNNLSVFERI